MPTSNQKHKELELSIIILSYNTAAVTKDCLDSIYGDLSDSTIPFEIIVVDNASKDTSVAMLTTYKKTHSELIVIESHENLGFSKGNNTAAKRARGKYLLFLNSDTIVLDQAIQKLLSYYKKNEDTVQFCGPKLLNTDNSPQPSCGPFYSLPVVFGALFLKGDYWGLTRSSPNETKQVDWVSGACILTKKEHFDKLNGFDEQIFMYMEEIDLLYRAKKLGMHTSIFPESRFIHLGSASSGGKTYPILQVYNGFLYFYKKHHSPFAVGILKGMLQLKAITSILIGKITQSTYLTDTYEKAYRIASMD
jgi:GT2 family glycosyltransferase